MNLIENSYKSPSKPLVSFILIAYNQEDFIQEAIEGAFSQNYSPLEIILSDDSSKDRTYEIMQKMAKQYTGPHQIRLNYNQNNLGLARHVNSVIQMARGKIIVLAAGDDISMSNRVKCSVDILESFPDLNCVSFDAIKFTHSSELDLNNQTTSADISSMEIATYELEDLIKDSSLHTNGATRAMRKHVVDYFGPLNLDSPTEDSPYFLRCLLLGKGAQVKQPLAFYRVHGNNLFASDNKYGFNYDVIHDQYLKDISTTLERGDIDKKQSKRTINSLNKKLSNNKVRNGFHISNNKRKFFLATILPCQTLRMKQKIRYFKRSFLKT